MPGITIGGEVLMTSDLEYALLLAPLGISTLFAFGPFSFTDAPASSNIPSENETGLLPLNFFLYT